MFNVIELSRLYDSVMNVMMYIEHNKPCHARMAINTSLFILAMEADNYIDVKEMERKISRLQESLKKHRFSAHLKVMAIEEMEEILALIGMWISMQRWKELKIA